MAISNPRPRAILDDVEKQLFDTIHDTINNNELLQSESFSKVSALYDEAERSLDTIKEQQSYLPDTDEIIDLVHSVKKGRGSFVSTLATMLAKKMVEHVKVPFVEITLDEIRVRTEGRQKKIEIKNMDTALFTINPIATVTFQAFGVPQVLEAKFQIDASVRIPEMFFSGTPEEADIDIGRMIFDLKLSLLEIDIDGGKIRTGKTLGERQIEVDLKGHKFSRQHSTKCSNCGTPNPSQVDFCCECRNRI
jgi:hypothetical protein